jgi:NCAIR mutase (PurE)-related protein
MNASQLRALLDRVRDGAVDPTAASDRILEALRTAPYEDLGFARVDHHRDLRQGFPEVILGVGKTPAQIAAIAERIVSSGRPLLVTRAQPEAFDAVAAVVPSARYHPDARAITLSQGEIAPGRGTVMIASAGTADQPIAEEAAITAELMGNTIDRLYDVGVAGIHRLLREHTRLQSARVVIVVAGMEGALPSVVAGLVSVPVVAVPTSVGYGASFGGIAALLGMLNSCANGVSVVNIDNGFGAGCIASQINHLP